MIKNKELEQAQDLMWTAVETQSKTERIALARQALSICPDCADAYVVLAQDTGRTAKERIELFESGVKAGRRALGSTYFKNCVGEFWLILETRPYLRSLFGLSVELLGVGKTEEAIEHFREQLRLNKSDNQGVRYLLAPLLVSLERLPEAEKLIKKYPDDVGPEIRYSRTLLLFKKMGDSSSARNALAEAVRWNRHVVSWLLIPKLPLRIKTPDRCVVGGKVEAYFYAKSWRKSWHQTKGAIEWVIENLLLGYQSDKKLWIIGPEESAKYQVMD